MANTPYYQRPQRGSDFVPNRWDLIILLLLLGLFSLFVWGASQMAVPYELGHKIPISLDWHQLPRYAINTVIRMAIALLLSLLFTFTVGTLAAKSRRAERIILPFIDVMQSVPLLGFLSISVLAFVYLFKGSQLGPECAAIFAIFTSQVWNMALSFYQSLRTVPNELREAAAMFHLSPWQRFWRLEVPFATPGLIWNTMMSLSAGWFFVVAAEAISVNNQHIFLPGIGSYIYMATHESNYMAIGYVILTMFIVILAYDQFIFRPLVAWSDKFSAEPDTDVLDDPWFLNVLRRARLMPAMLRLLKGIRDLISTPRLPHIPRIHPTPRTMRALSWFQHKLNSILVICAIIGACYMFWRFIYQAVGLNEIGHVFILGLITALKVMILIALCSLIWVPIGVWVGLRPRLSRMMQPVAQFLAAFPANLVYPVLFMLIVTYQLNVNIWTAPLMILGTQWYVLFNVIAGTSSLPQELHLATRNYGVKKWLWWRKFILPGIFPFYITGVMTAAGGCWNASIVAEVVNWGNQSLYATGLGGYIAKYTTSGNFPRIGLGIAVMSLYVILINRLVWQKLYDFAQNRYDIG